jgi:hypothetical protein
MAQTYEETLRRLLAEAEDEANLYAHLTGPNYKYPVTVEQAITHEVFQHVRILASHALRQFHPEIK